MLTLASSSLAGRDCIDDDGPLRPGGTDGVLGCVVKAPSTPGTFLRSSRGAMSAGQARIVEAGESAGIHQTGIYRLNVWLSRRCDTHRESHREMPARIPRQWVAIGNSNDLIALPGGSHWKQAYCNYPRATRGGTCGARVDGDASHIAVCQDPGPLSGW